MPTRSRTPGQAPDPGDLGEGQIALNLADRRIWIGVAEEIDPAGYVEVTSLEQLFDHWAHAIERHTRPR